MIKGLKATVLLALHAVYLGIRKQDDVSFIILKN
ncbi:hypothetical protein XFLM_09990 [Xylella fastidiosa subsp. fastidiosa GB514]|jgi:hypothetical protein|uniref:Uncharacterized protein n=1 Tax=Xylella fastidiosa subsp. sandyi Ann-1 TaxID=155920 RepID=A0A060HEX3_XYLFS|nr:hypothetical protein XFLM_09990 [Xylella fastidiosa subsp. fastidiosa GB514]AIC11472.1 hypothetical protein D934_09650 [Xylella fastidiosa subsp. sandyi Ann-1]KAF0572075.1 hypothetical protein P305_01515 [Xylella fastidiosa subsp. fastidiosa Mus-1]